MTEYKKKFDVSLMVLLILFAVTQICALWFTRPFHQGGMEAFENPDDPLNILYYVVIILIFTGVILYIAKKGKDILIRSLILFIFSITVFYLFHAFLSLFISTDIYSLAGGLFIALMFGILLLFYPEWYVVDVIGILVACGIIAIFGISLTVPLAILLLALLAMYDAISVYKTKHMIDLGDTILRFHLPMLMVIPKKWGYSFRKEKNFSGKKNAIFIGLGDFIIPGILAASVFHFGKSLSVALACILGSVIGLALLMVLAKSGKPHAGLPWLNGGALIGYLISSLLLGELIGFQ
jgi:presenilin-like A22 family membrane protease